MYSDVRHKLQHKEVMELRNNDKKYYKPFENYHKITNPTVRIWQYICENGTVKGPFCSLVMDWWYHHDEFPIFPKVKLVYSKDFIQHNLLFSKKQPKNKLKLRIQNDKIGPKYKSARKASTDKIKKEDYELKQQKTNIVKPKKDRFTRFRQRH